LNGLVWLAMGSVGLVVAAQYSHAVLQQTKFLWYGTSLSDVSLRPMWQYPTFKPWYYVWETSWNQDALLPMLGLAAALGLAVRHPLRERFRFLLVIHVGACLTESVLL